MSTIEILCEAWLREGVDRVLHDDDGERIVTKLGNAGQRARFKPKSKLAEAVATVLCGAGFAIPVGDGTFLVEVRDEGI